MPCEPMQATRRDQLNAQDKARLAVLEAQRQAALAKLEAKLRVGDVKMEKDRVTGKLRLVGWAEQDRAGWQDGCALDALRTQRSSTLLSTLRAIGATEQAVIKTHGH